LLVALLITSSASAQDAFRFDADAIARRVAALPVAASVAVKNVVLAEGANVSVALAAASKVAPPDDVVPVHISDKRLHLPLLEGRVVQWYGTTDAADSNTRVRHTGWTILARRGHRIRNVAEGVVVFAEARKGYGLLVVIAHPGGYHSVYAHLEEIGVQVGERVERGRAIGVIGSTGSLNGTKLYFEWRLHGRPIDPQGWFAPANTEKTRQ
jgi:septal ring factor EnvC (AmiA/AmiB activator)